MVHSVLSQIKTESNLQTALLKVDNEKRERVNEVIQSMFKFAQAQHWFDGTYKILNEKSIVDKSSEETIETKRPDRIMIQGGFSFGNDNNFAGYVGITIGIGKSQKH